MIFRIGGPRGKPLPVTLSDIVHAITATHPSLRWFLGEFYGAGNVDILYPGGRTCEGFTTDVESAPPVLSAQELLSVASATFDIYDVFIVGVRDDEPIKRSVLRDPNERFRTIADRYAAVAECVDSGFWRISVKDDTLAQVVIGLLAALPDVTVSECSLTD